MHAHIGVTLVRSAAVAVVVVVVVTALAATGCAGHTAAQPSGPAWLYGPSQRPQGQSYATINAGYLEWGFGITASQSPVLHADAPRNCEVHGPFVYAGGAGTEKACVVPHGKAVVLSFAGLECSTAEGNGATFEKLRTCANRSFARSYEPQRYRFTLQLDGTPVPHPRRWAFTSADRVITMPTTNLFNTAAGPTKSVSRGFVYVLRPLSAGTHVVRGHAHDAETGKLTFVYRFRSAP
ncbi:MAG: hypothetical protein ACTHOK_07110 [Nocardioidaceae bacterium]